MTEKATENIQGPELKPEQLIEDEHPPAEEPLHPGWLRIGEILKAPHAAFTNSRFLIGYHHSSNAYLLAGDGLTLVDPGNDYTIFFDFKALGFELTDIRKVVLTHGHRDHCMGIFELLGAPGVMENKNIEILMHEAGPQELKRLVSEAGFPPTELSGGETLELSGFEWEVLHTPGHTMDSICLYHPPTGVLISGDAVLPDSMAEVDKSAGGSLEHYLYGLRQIMRRNIVHVLPGHGVPVACTGSRAVEESYEAVMLKVLETAPEDKLSWMEGARRLAEKGLLGEVVYCCDRELALRPGNLHAMQLKGLTLNDMGRCEEAMEVFDRILAREPENIYALTAGGQALLGLTRYVDSLSYFDRALARAPAMREAQVFKGMALYFLGKADKAMEIEAFKSEFHRRFSKGLAAGQKK